MPDYPQLGNVRDAKMIYIDGDEVTHPSGHVYKLIGGNWVHQRPKCAVPHGTNA